MEISMKKRFLLLITSLCLLSGCSSNESNEINANKPYEIIKGTATLSYYDTVDNINIDGFNVLENTIQNFQDKNNNIIVNDSGIIRCITVVDESVKTYQSISVGDSIDEIENTFEYEHKVNDSYNVIFNNDTEENLANQNQEDTWICITYYTDGSKITSIRIYDVLYGRVFQ